MNLYFVRYWYFGGNSQSNLDCRYEKSNCVEPLFAVCIAGFVGVACIVDFVSVVAGGV